MCSINWTDNPKESFGIDSVIYRLDVSNSMETDETRYKPIKSCRNGVAIELDKCIHTIIMKSFIKWNIDIVGNSLLALLL